MSIEGKIHIQLDPGSDAPVQIRSSRPGEVTRLFEGLPADAVIDRIPALFNLCGQAQGLAARLACSALEACAQPSREAQEGALCEALQAYLWRFLVDLPRLLGQEPEMAAYAPLHRQLRGFSQQAPAIRRQILDALAALLSRELLGMGAARWRSQSAAALEEWLRHHPAPLAVRLREAERRLAGLPGTGSPVLMPDSPEVAQLQALGQWMTEKGFVREPRWDGVCMETGALSYQQHHPWIRFRLDSGAQLPTTRLVARLLDTLELYRRLDENDLSGLCGAQVLESGAALGWVRTARGLLLHREAIGQGRVEDYRILAPTEWNFHPRGALFQGLESWLAAPPEQLQAWVAWQVLSLDPCVSHEFEVKHA
ncbi:hypothetical protein [Motiliproteus sp. SC1-56]|uniref:hypothetical protein n=1 Tax=Motiliproteus sp. SC1-56 TaxID=2799565 RepID=UPI001A909477|nr:hypothetical protein [Motiliproteus sp. SC1-56]